MSDELAHQFVDAHILVCAYDKSAGIKRKYAETALQSLWESRIGCLSIQVLQEFYVVATQKITEPLSVTQAMQIITDFGRWRTHKPDVTE